MNALSGDYAHRTQSIFAAGLDIVLHCNGVMEQMIEVAASTPQLSGKALERANAALAALKPAGNEDIAALRREYDGLLEAL
jgi:beta-N-acetylhexosaminidase